MSLLEDKFDLINARADRRKHKYSDVDGAEVLIQMLKEKEYELLEIEVELDFYKRLCKLKEDYDDI